MDWAIWRVVTHPRTHETLINVQTLWSFQDLMDANDTLDALDAAEERANAK